MCYTLQDIKEGLKCEALGSDGYWYPVTIKDVDENGTASKEHLLQWAREQAQSVLDARRVLIPTSSTETDTSSSGGLYEPGSPGYDKRNEYCSGDLEHADVIDLVREKVEEELTPVFREAFSKKHEHGFDPRTLPGPLHLRGDPTKSVDFAPSVIITPRTVMSPSVLITFSPMAQKMMDNKVVFSPHYQETRKRTTLNGAMNAGVIEETLITHPRTFSDDGRESDSSILEPAMLEIRWDLYLK